MRSDHGHAAGTGPLRLLYAEDDPALRTLLAQRLAEHEAVDAVVAVANPAEAVAVVEGGGIDAALLDLALGDWRLNGFELGLALRASARLLPIVMFSQHPPARIEDVLPAEERHHWSYVRKHGQIDIDDLVATVQRTRLGISRFEVAGADDAIVAESVLQRLSPRQREIMALAATGLDARAIADQVHLTHVSVRRELSRAYRVLVPEAGAGTDLRTAAVLEYLRAGGGTGPGAG